jgi:hypothetical protein
MINGEPDESRDAVVTSQTAGMICTICPVITFKMIPTTILGRIRVAASTADRCWIF